MFSFIKNAFASRSLKAFEARVEEINSLEADIKALSDAELKEESGKLRVRAQAAEPLDELLPRAFALAREAAYRTLGQRPFDVQLVGGMALHSGAVAEMMTGEGKTLTAVLSAYLNALTGKGVHVVTVNEYLARRDAVWMGQIYRALGLSIACLVPNAAFLYDPDYVTQTDADPSADRRRHEAGQRKSAVELDKERDEKGSFLVEQEFLRPITRREAYLADVTYGTNHEFGFDYLRDNLAYRLEDQVQIAKEGAGTAHHYAIIDEVDSILIDEARTPLIIAAPDSESSELYKTFARIAKNLKKDEDFTIEEKLRHVAITEHGISKVEQMIGVQNLYAPEQAKLVHYLEESLRAVALFHRDKDYVVKGGEVIIVDEFTGRMLHGRRYNGGLHQAIEAKEGVQVKEESKTYAKISIQNYFRMYEKIAGMTGTAQTSAEEFHKVYHLEVISVPPNRPFVRKDAQDFIYKNAAVKWRAIVKDIKERHEKGQPILVGTTSIEKNELLSILLGQANIEHEVLNAKNNEREGAIIAQAGRAKGVTVATNMAGRGVDIVLGGNPPNADEADKVRGLGGLHVIGTERHEARRIDNQLRGRAGRQGDPGSSQFFLSAEDDLLRIFGGDRMRSLMERFDLPDDEPIQMGFVSKSVAEAQAKVEGANFDTRKHLLEYDDVLNKQRGAVYKKRKDVLESVHKGELAAIILDASSAYAESVVNLLISNPEGRNVAEELKKGFEESGIGKLEVNDDMQPEVILDTIKEMLAQRSAEVGTNPQAAQGVLSVLDLLWMSHLENLEALSESVGLRAYGQHDPLAEYRNDAKKLYSGFWQNFNGWVFSNIFKLKSQMNADSHPRRSAQIDPRISASTKVGRNDPCPCGSGKKYKRCHGV